MSTFNLTNFLRANGVSQVSPRVLVPKKGERRLPTLSKLNQKTSQQIFNTSSKQHNHDFSIFIYLLLDIRLAFPYLPLFETDTSCSRLVLRHIASATTHRSGRTGIAYCYSNPGLMSRILQINQHMQNTPETLNAAELLVKCGRNPQSFSNELLTHLDVVLKQSSPTLNASFFGKLLVINSSTGQYLLSSRGRLDGDEGGVLRNPPLPGKAFTVGANVLHGNDLTQKPTQQLISFPSDTKFFLIEADQNATIGLTLEEALFIMQILWEVPKKHFKDFLKPWVSTLKHCAQFRTALQITSALKISSMSTYLSNVRVFSREVISNKDLYHDPCYNVHDVVQSLISDKIPSSELEAFVVSRFPFVKFRTIRGYFSGLSFFYNHLSKSGKRFWESYSKLRLFLTDLAKTYDEVPEGSAALNWEQMRKLFDLIWEFECELISREVFYDLCIISFWCLFRTSESINLDYLDVVLFNLLCDNLASARVCIIGPKTSTVLAPCQFIQIHEIEKPEWKQYCPIAAFQRRFARRQQNSSFMFTNKKGKKISKTLLTSVFADFSKFFRQRYPNFLEPDAKLTFYTFRISCLGFLIIEVGFTIQEAQLVIRHAPGSKVTEEVYLAKHKAAAGASARQKLQNWVTKNTVNPQDVTFFLNPDGSIETQGVPTDTQKNSWFSALPKQYQQQFANFF